MPAGGRTSPFVPTGGGEGVVQDTPLAGGPRGLSRVFEGRSIACDRAVCILVNHGRATDSGPREQRSIPVADPSGRVDPLRFGSTRVDRRRKKKTGQTPLESRSPEKPAGRRAKLAWLLERGALDDLQIGPARGSHPLRGRWRGCSSLGSCRCAWPQRGQPAGGCLHRGPEQLPASFLSPSCERGDDSRALGLTRAWGLTAAAHSLPAGRRDGDRLPGVKRWAPCTTGIGGAALARLPHCNRVTCSMRETIASGARLTPEDLSAADARRVSPTLTGTGAPDANAAVRRVSRGPLA